MGPFTCVPSRNLRRGDRARHSGRCRCGRSDEVIGSLQASGIVESQSDMKPGPCMKPRCTRPSSLTLALKVQVVSGYLRRRNSNAALGTPKRVLCLINYRLRDRWQARCNSWQLRSRERNSFEHALRPDDHLFMTVTPADQYRMLVERSKYQRTQRFPMLRFFGRIGFGRRHVGWRPRRWTSSAKTCDHRNSHT
jgi:hypothetical protein